jgi:hypothetical protein
MLQRAKIKYEKTGGHDVDWSVTNPVWWLRTQSHDGGHVVFMFSQDTGKLISVDWDADPDEEIT